MHGRAKQIVALILLIVMAYYSANAFGISASALIIKNITLKRPDNLTVKKRGDMRNVIPGLSHVE